MDYRVTYATGCAPNLPWWKALAMTDDEIRAYNDQFLRRETKEWSDDMADIVEQLRSTIDRRSGTADSDVNALAIPVEVPWGYITAAITEIERLRATIAELRLVAGPVSIDAVKFADIKKFAKNPVLGEFNDGK